MRRPRQERAARPRDNQLRVRVQTGALDSMERHMLPTEQNRQAMEHIRAYLGAEHSGERGLVFKVRG